MLIPFNKPLLIGNELKYIRQAVQYGKISGDGFFTHQCEHFFETHFNFKRCLLTTSCTDALEMCAILLDIQEGDEVILPTYTFVSMANAFYMRGATLVFADSRADHPGIDEDKIEALITPKTKAIIVMHYAGVACDMDKINALAKQYKLFVVEDAAHAIDSHYKNKALGSLGDLATFSFHETKNVSCGEGGMLVIQHEGWKKRAEIIREKGTNRKQFLNGSIDKYNWVDIGSSFLPSEISAAYLYAQLECLAEIQTKRKILWNAYYNAFQKIKSMVRLPFIPEYADNNAHVFYLVCKNIEQRDALLQHLRNKNIYAVFHYQNLHQSPFIKMHYQGKELPHAERYNNCLVRLPLYYDLSVDDVNERIIPEVLQFFLQE